MWVTRIACSKAETWSAPRSRRDRIGSMQLRAYTAHRGCGPVAVRGTAASVLPTRVTRWRKNDVVRNGRSQATTTVCSDGALTSAVYTPLSGPAPGIRSAHTRRPDPRKRCGSLVTIRMCSATCRSTDSCRSIIRQPPTVRAHLSTPPRRVAWPPAMMAAVRTLRTLGPDVPCRGPTHPIRLRRSSLPYSGYARSSRVVRRAPRRAKLTRLF